MLTNKKGSADIAKNTQILFVHSISIVL